MLLAQATEKQEFLREMARGIAEQHSESGSLWIVGVSIGSLLALILTGNYIYSNLDLLRGRWIRLKKILGGAPRGKPRYKVKVDLVIDVPLLGEKVYRTTTANLSPSGMFVKVNPPLARKEIFRFRLGLPGEEGIMGTAEVLWVQSVWTEHHPTGIGCKFTSISDTDRNRIRLWIQKNKPPRQL
ncbi:MAG: hypothetical protein JWQ35_1429 [Bacteriovoracaceae bacterium]|nr:hypothetical protein [Bacteriovoracaceae bacterium]